MGLGPQDVTTGIDPDVRLPVSSPAFRRDWRYSNQDLANRFRRIIRRAGLDPWPKPFQDLRSTRETELAEEFPLHVVCAWIGNSQAIAAKHYLQVTDEHFRQAAGAAPAPSAPAPQPALPPDLADAWADLPERIKSATLAPAANGAESNRR